MTILCSMSTRGRYDTTLLSAMLSVAMQTKKPDKFVLFDDNDVPRDLRENPNFQYMFEILNYKGIEWAVEFGQKKGQHYNHQRANTMGYDWVWRLDDDTVAEPDVLEKLHRVATVVENVGAVGGAVLTPPFDPNPNGATGLIANLSSEPNIQWSPIVTTKEVDHLHCSFLYRAGVVDYNLNLSRVAHREETLFTYGLKKAGYDIFVTPAVTWHLRNKEGGIRDGLAEMFEHDERIFQAEMQYTIVVLDCGMGDHIVFKRVLPDVTNPLVFSCYPDIIPGHSIADAHRSFGPDLTKYSIYALMDRWGWTGSLEDAYRKLYNAPRKS